MNSLSPKTCYFPAFFRATSELKHTNKMPTYYNALCRRAYWCTIAFYQINLNCNAAVLVLTVRECTISQSLNASYENARWHSLKPSGGIWNYMAEFSRFFAFLSYLAVDSVDAHPAYNCPNHYVQERKKNLLKKKFLGPSF